MKNHLLQLALFSIIIFSLNSCREYQKKEEEATKEIKAPKQIISLAQAKETYDNYTRRRTPLIKRYEDSINNYRTKFTPSRYGSYDYKTIKQYIAYIEQEAKLANVEISTLRFYFSNYPDKEEFNDGKKVVSPRQNSFFISPTIKKENKDYGFYIIENDKGERSAGLLSDDIKELNENNLGNSNTVTKKSYASFLPNTTTTNTISPPLFVNHRSVMLNEVNMSPPANN